MRFKRRLHTSAKVDLIPMIDVVFQLVIFFMVSSTFIITPGIPLTLPNSSTAEPVAMSKLVITLISREEVYINKSRYTLKEAEELLSEMGAERREEIKSVVLEGDSELPYELIVSVLDILRKHGFSAINLKMRQGPEEGTENEEG